jgi:predicted transcriptional regulator
MRTLVDIKERQLRLLDQLAKKQKRPRAALIRDAVADYLEKRIAHETSAAFGLWGKRTIDGLDYQDKIRSEW